MNVNMNAQEQTYKKPGAGAVIGGVVAGSAVNNLTKISSNIVSPKLSKTMQNLSNSLTTDQFSKVEKAINDTLTTSGLKDKGVSIIKATAENAEEINNIITKEADRGIFKHLPKQCKELLGTIYSSQMASGENACYTFGAKKIIMPEKKLGLAVFHEAGHAMNANLSKFGKILQKCRPMTILALPVAMIALFKTKKAEGEEPKNGLDKATTFVKNNAGKLTFAAFLPMVLEEGLASLKGNNYAKKLLSPELAKKVAKTNALGFASYLALATTSALGICLGTKVKDAIAHKKQAAENK